MATSTDPARPVNDEKDWIELLRQSTAWVAPPETALDSRDTSDLAWFEGDGPSVTDKQCGQIWLARPGKHPGLSALVLLTYLEPPHARGLVFSDRLWIATVDDVILPADQVSCGQAMVACMWRDVPVDLEALEAHVGELDPGAYDAVAMLCQHRLTGGFTRLPVGTIVRGAYEGLEEAAPRLMRWHITSPHGTRREYLSGGRIVDPLDPRIPARCLFYEATRHVEMRALEAMESADPVDQYAKEPTIKRWLSALQATLARSEFGASLWSSGTHGWTAGVAGMVFGMSALPVLYPNARLKSANTFSTKRASEWRRDHFDIVVTRDTLTLGLRARPVDDRDIALNGTVLVAGEGAAGVGVTLRAVLPDGRAFGVPCLSTAPDGNFSAAQVPLVQGASYSLHVRRSTGQEVVFHWML